MIPARALSTAAFALGAAAALATVGCGGASSATTPAAPTAAFTVSSATPAVNQTVVFTDGSTGSPTSWSWTFGDGTTSNLPSPTHIFTAAGTYTVSLTAANAGGSHTATRTVAVTPAAPVAAFGWSPSAPAAGQTVTFSDASTGGATSWSWSFGDGGTSTSQNPVHAYAAAGSYPVTLTATNAGGSNTLSRTVTVTAGFALSSSVGSTGGTLPIDYTLDGAGVSPDLAWSNAPAGTKEYAVVMTTLPGDGSTLWNWVLYRIPATASGLARANATVGVGGKTSHTVLGYAPPQSTGPGSKRYTFTVHALSASPSLPTDPSAVTGEVLSSAISGMTLASASLDLDYTRGAPAAAFTSTNNGTTATFTSACGLSTTSWAWSFGDGATSTQANPVHAYPASGTYTVGLTAGNAFGTRTVTRTVSISQTTPSAAWFPSPASPGAGQMAVFTDASLNGPTTWAWSFGDGATSTKQHPTHTYASPGTYTVTLVATNASGSNTSSHTVTVGAAVASTAKMNMEQTLSDQAQRTTLAFSGLAMITGNLEAQSFYPPGKVADYTGFQFLRDNDPNNMGHNTSFLTRVANNVIFILTDAQLAQLAELATRQQADFELYGYKRFTLMKAFRRLLEGDLPTGATALNLNAVKQASAALYLIDGQVSYDRALLYASIYSGLSSSQRAYLDAMVGKGWASWPDVPDAVVQAKMKTLPQGSAVAVMTYASDIFSWYACGVEGDVYFCPERQGTYYGGFYIKDAPAIGHEGYAIDEQLTATAGEALSNATKGYVDASQAALMSSLVDAQRNAMYAGSTSIVQCRTEIATLLRTLRTTSAYNDLIKARVLELSALYGELDGANNHQYATVFAQVYKSLTTAQKTKMMDLRKAIMSGKYADGTAFDFTTCTTPFLYSAVISNTGLLAPYFAASDALFFEPK